MEEIMYIWFDICNFITLHIVDNIILIITFIPQFIEGLLLAKRDGMFDGGNDVDKDRVRELLQQGKVEKIKNYLKSFFTIIEHD